VRAAPVAFGVLGLFVVASCSLGLDETKIGAGPNATLPDRGTDSGTADVAVDAAPASVVQSCAVDADCTSTNGCTKGKCDVARKACVYDVCRAAACSASTCNLESATCGASTMYKYRPTQLSLGAQIACGNCAAAVYPYLFVVLTTGLTAFNVANPANPTPAQVPIVGLGFVPTQLVVSGSRLFMLGGQSGPGPSRVTLAYLDVPSSPFASKLNATSVLATDDRPAEGISLFPRSAGTAILVGPGAPSPYPSAVLVPPLVEPLSVTTTALAPVPGTIPVATSGTRLLMSGITAGLATFNFITAAGSAAPQSQAAVTIADAGQVSTARRWAQSTDGAIFWATNVHQGSPDMTTRATRGYFLVPNDTGAVATSPGVDIEVYDVPAQGVGANVNSIAPIAMLDASTAMIATQARENATQTAVQFVKNNPLGIVKEADNVTLRRQVLPVNFGVFAAATASNGIGYLVANDQPGPPAVATVYVFDPACTP